MPTDDRQNTVVREYMLVIKRRAWIVVACVAVAVAIALLVAMLRTPRYLSTATLVFQAERRCCGARSTSSASIDIERELNTSAQLVTAARSRLQPSIEEADIAVSVSAAAVETRTRSSLTDQHRRRGGSPRCQRVREGVRELQARPDRRALRLQSRRSS
jgi:hypothetical protein